MKRLSLSVLFLLCSSVFAHAAENDALITTPLRGQILGVDIPTETVTKRTIDYSVRTCLNLRSRKDLPKAAHVAVYKEGKSLKVLDVQEEDHGQTCVRWQDAITHEYYSNEHYSEQKYRIALNDNQIVEGGLIVNPWDSGATFAVDPRDISNSADILNKKGGDATLAISHMYLAMAAPNAKGEYVALVLLQTEAKRTDLFGQSYHENARDGGYVLTANILDKDGKSVGSRTVHESVKNGTIQTTLTFPKDTTAGVKVEFKLQPSIVEGAQVASEARTLSFE